MHKARKNRLLNTLEMRARRVTLRSLPYSIQLEVTTRCNLACIMCARDKYHGRGANLDDDILDRFLQDLLPASQDLIVSSFGEPFLYPRLDRLFDRIDPEAGLELGFFTNLLLLTEPMAERIVRGGVAYLNVSIDGATKETYETIRRGGKWEVLLEKLDLINRVKKRLGSDSPRLNLCVVGSTLNVHEIPRFVDFAREHGFVSVKYNHNLYVDDESMDHLSLVHAQGETARMFREGLRRAIELDVRSNFDQLPFPDAGLATAPSDAPQKSRGFSLQFHANSLKRRFHLWIGWRVENSWYQSGRDWRNFVLLISGKGRDFFLDRVPGLNRLRKRPPYPHPIPNDAPPETCGNPWTHAHVKCDGLVYPCCFSNEVMGDLRSQSFESIWNSPKYQALRKSLSSGRYWASCRRASCNWVKGSNSSLYGCRIAPSAPPAELAGPEGATLAVRVDNTGRFPWNPPQTDPVNFVSLSYRLFNSELELVDEGVHVPVSEPVQPDRSVTLNLPIAPIYYAGDLLLKLDMVHEGITWFGERGNNTTDLRIKVGRVPFAAYLGTWNKSLLQSVLSRPLRIGQSLEVPILVRNVGTAALGERPGQDFLSHHWRASDGEWVEWEGIRTEIAPPLGPGESRKISHRVEVPRTLAEGDYNLEFDLVRDGEAWLRCLWNRPLFSIPVRIATGEPGEAAVEEVGRGGRAEWGIPQGQCVSDPRNKGIW